MNTILRNISKQWAKFIFGSFHQKKKKYCTCSLSIQPAVHHSRFVDYSKLKAILYNKMSKWCNGKWVAVHNFSLNNKIERKSVPSQFKTLRYIPYLRSYMYIDHIEKYHIYLTLDFRIRIRPPFCRYIHIPCTDVRLFT